MSVKLSQEIQKLKELVAARYPNATLETDIPVHEDGFHNLDISYGGKVVCVGWSANFGYGVSLITKDTGYGEGFDTICKTQAEVFGEIEKLLKDLIAAP